MNSRRVYVPQLDREVLISITSVVHRALLDASREVEDFKLLPEGAHSDGLTYWSGEMYRLETAHAWLLELLQKTP